MSTLSRITTWNSGDTLTASALNGEFNNILNDYNGSITNANISGSAAIDASKISGTAVTRSATETISGVKTFSAAPKFTFGSQVAGDLFYDNATQLTRLALGSAGAMLLSNGTAPVWSSATRMKVVTFTYDLTTASGTQAVTGLGSGFTPSAFVFVGGINAGVVGSVGVDDGTTAGSLALNGAFTNWTIEDKSIVLVSSAGNYQLGKVTAVTDGGFTLTWVKTGSPTGTATITCLAFR